MPESVVIFAAKRAPIGRMNGQLVGFISPQLTAAAIKAAVAVTLLHALKACGCNRGIASLCIGGGEATAFAAELI